MFSKTNTKASTRFHIDGTNPPDGVLTAKMISSYQSANPKGTGRLLIGLADKESTFQQFASFTHPTYKVSGQWPKDNSAAPNGGGGYVGLLQVETTMQTAFDWSANIDKSASLMATKVTEATNSMNNSRKANPKLPLLNSAQLEQNAIMKYGPYGSGGYYWVSNKAGTAWIVTTTNASGVSYVNDVLSRINKH